MAKQTWFYRLNNSEVARGSCGLSVVCLGRIFGCALWGCSRHSLTHGRFAHPSLSFGARGGAEGCQGSFLESRGGMCEPRVFLSPELQQHCPVRDLLVLFSSWIEQNKSNEPVLNFFPNWAASDVLTQIVWGSWNLSGIVEQGKHL